MASRLYQPVFAVKYEMDVFYNNSEVLMTFVNIIGTIFDYGGQNGNYPK